MDCSPEESRATAPAVRAQRSHPDLFFARLHAFRFVLAFAVVGLHTYPGAFRQSGLVAVQLFFFVSGFLITRLLQTVYAGRPADFLANRFLRIYPTYWIALALGLAVIALTPEIAASTNPALALPRNLIEALDNIAIFGLSGSPLRIVPPAWSLNIELVWYAVLFGASFAPRRLRIGLLLALLFVPLMYLASGERFYATFYGSGFAFALGSLYQEWRPRLPAWMETIAAASCLWMIFCNPLLFSYAGAKDLGPALALYLTPFLLFAGFGFFLRSRPWELWAVPLFIYLGRLSYPVFLTHFHAATIVLWLDLAEKGGPVYFAMTLALSLIISTLILAGEMPLERLRTRIRGQQLVLRGGQEVAAP